MKLSRNRLIVIGSTIALVIGIAAIAIPAVTSLGSVSSSGDALTVSGGGPGSEADENRVVDSTTAMLIGDLVAPAVEDSAVANFWAIPVDAPFSTFPRGEACDGKQREWLMQHASPARMPAWHSTQARVHNSADAGGSLALTNIRLEGAWVDVTPTISFVCIGLGDSGIQSIKLTRDGSPGTWTSLNGYEENPQPDGSIATVNLAPGEVAELYFELPEADEDFTGKIVADLVGSSGELVILAQDVSFPASLLDGYGFVFPYGETLTCTSPDTPFGADCTFAEAEELMREAGQHAARRR